MRWFTNSQMRLTPKVNAKILCTKTNCATCKAHSACVLGTMLMMLSYEHTNFLCYICKTDSFITIFCVGWYWLAVAAILNLVDSKSKFAVHAEPKKKTFWVFYWKPSNDSMDSLLIDGQVWLQQLMPKFLLPSKTVLGLMLSCNHTRF